MNTQNPTPVPVIPGIDWFFRWVARHPRLSAALLFLQGLLLLYIVITYNFTIPGYK